MAILRSPSALLSRYREQYRQKPHSRVFAPLAEAYRKLGMRDEALKILKDGIRRHPAYALGYLVLSQCYADEGQWDRVQQTLQPLVPAHKDNPALQKLYAQACLNIGDTEGALETFKWLLFLNPQDKAIASQVKALEDDHVGKRRTVSRDAIIKSPATFETDSDDWSMQDFAPQASNVVEEKDTLNPAKAEEWQVMSRALDDDFFSDEEISPEDSPEPWSEKNETASPLISHTLVDLYLAQDHRSEAIELLEKYVEADPSDQRSRRRLQELRGQMFGKPPAPEQDEGEDELMRLVETAVHSPGQKKTERALHYFLELVQSTARLRQEAHATLPRR